MSEYPFINYFVKVLIAAVYIIFLLAGAYSYIAGIKKSIEAAHKQELLLQLEDDTSNLEEMYSDMRKFRHDYINIISAIHGYIEAKDLDGLEEFFISEIDPVAKRIKGTNSTLDRLKNIQIFEVKGLVALKLMQTQERGAEIHIEVSDEIQSVNFNIISLTRVLGIFIDNAMEACMETESKLVEFAVMDKNDEVTFIIANSFNAPLPMVTDMVRDGFSTKGEKRGLGLFSVQQIIDKNEHVVLNTYIDNNMFVQELKIFEYTR